MTRAATVTRSHSAPGSDAAASAFVLAKVGEASLKGRNRRHFLGLLKRNLRANLAGLDVAVEGGGSVFVIASRDRSSDQRVASRVEQVFGFVTASVAHRCERDAAAIAAVAVRAMADRRPVDFAVRARRRDKSFRLTSQEIECEVGREIQERTGLPVRLRRPDHEVRVELDHDFAYVHVRELEGAGGLPVGASGRALALLSGGIDSPVAALLAMKRGLSVDFLHFSGEPYLDPMAQTKAQAQAKVLNGLQAGRPGTLWVVPFGRQQRALSAVSAEPDRIVLYRRQMMRVASALAERLDAAALVTGDSLGQVSSQTLPNMTSIEEASALPVLRPLLAFDKREVMGRAARLGILAISELPADDACPLFAGGKQRAAVPRKALLSAETELDLRAMALAAAGAARRVDPGTLLDPLAPESRAA